jgi:murein DD-endopeptidase MepM/ murein hydrolase activator NlpD
VIRSFRTRGQHQGIDYVAPKGTAVVTVAEGTVVHAGPNGGYGNLVVVDHGGGVNTYYAHLSAFAPGVHEGARVERGQEIGQVGSTGRSTGPHLHYEIRKDGQYLDPADPAQSLPNWSLGAEEHRAALTRLLALSLSRGQGMARAARPPVPLPEPGAQTAAAE